MWDFIVRIIPSKNAMGEVQVFIVYNQSTIWKQQQQTEVHH